jgi:hypothetical protein
MIRRAHSLIPVQAVLGASDLEHHPHGKEILKGIGARCPALTRQPLFPIVTRQEMVVFP